MGSQPTHQDVITTVSQLCGNSIAEFEAGLKAQVESDQVAHEEMTKAKEKAQLAEEAARFAAEEAARLTAELAENERKRLAEMEMETDNVGFSTKCAWLDVQDIGDKDNNNNNENCEEEDGNNLAADEVRIEYHLSVLFSTNHDYFRGLVRSPSAC